MSNSISLLGLQWGDEGKGKVVDVLSKDIDAAVRYQGGHNAGHTLIDCGWKENSISLTTFIHLS